jgi:DNA mismatch repair protein MutH
MTAAIVQRSVSFYSDELVAIQQGETTYTSVKPVCDILGIDWEAQRQRIERDEVLASTTCVIQAVGADGRQRYML